VKIPFLQEQFMSVFKKSTIKTLGNETEGGMVAKNFKVYCFYLKNLFLNKSIRVSQFSMQNFEDNLMLFYYNPISQT
jgi:hypothetical protein